MFLQLLPERLFALCQKSLVFRRIDEWIENAPCLEPIRFVLKVKKGAVGGKKDIAGQGSEPGKGVHIIGDDLRVGLVVDQLVSGWSRSAAQEHHIVGPRAFLNLHGPRCATGRMPRSQHRMQHDSAELNSFTIFDHLIHLDRREHKAVAKLRIVMATALKQRLISGARHHLGASELLERRKPAGMVQMGMTVEEDVDVAYFEPEVFDVLLNHGSGFGKAPIQQDQPLRGRDQERSNFGCPDIVDVPDQLEGLHRFVPCPGNRIALRESRNGEY